MSKYYWEDTIEYARYIDENRKNVEIMYIVDDDEAWSGKKAKLLVMPANVKDKQFRALLGYYTLDDIMEMTYNYNKDAAAAFKQQVLNIARKDGSVSLSSDMLTEDFVKKFIEIVFNEEMTQQEEKEIIFKAKLQLFELDLVKSSKKRTLKSKIRKATSLLEVLSAVYELKVAEESKTDTQ